MPEPSQLPSMPRHISECLDGISLLSKDAVISNFVRTLAALLKALLCQGCLEWGIGPDPEGIALTIRSVTFLAY